MIAVERNLAEQMARRGLMIAPIVVAAGWLAGGAPGAGAASLGLALVVGNFLLAGAMLSVAARISLAFYQGAALFGFLLRLGLITLAFLAVTRLVEIDRLIFGLSLVVSYLTLLTWQTVTVAHS